MILSLVTFCFIKQIIYFNESKRAYCCKLNKLIFNVSIEPSIFIIVLDASIKNNVATSITYIYSFNNLLKKILHHTNITLTEAELFVLRCGINQAVQMLDFSQIIVITDALHVAQKIFNIMIYPY